MNETKHWIPVTIIRSIWHCGKGSSGSMLLTSEDKMCCLGFCSIADGATIKAIENCAMPANAGTLKWLNSEFTKECARANDSLMVNKEKREQNVTRLLARAGFEVTIVD